MYKFKNSFSHQGNRMRISTNENTNVKIKPLKIPTLSYIVKLPYAYYIYKELNLH